MLFHSSRHSAWATFLAFAASMIAAEAQRLGVVPDGAMKVETHGASIVWAHELKPGAELPANMTHQTFESRLAGARVGYCIYLPPAYDTSKAERYPVIYNLHGNGGNTEFHGMEEAELLHKGILEGKWPPMIMVFPNGGISTFYKDSHDGVIPMESIVIKELIPHIDATYRTIASREGRCIEGFSMGGRGSTRLAVKHPDLFCSLFCQAGNVPAMLEKYDEGGDWKSIINGYLGPDRQAYVDNDVFAVTEKNLKQIKGRLRILIACGTKDGGHLPTVRNFHNHLVNLKVDHTYMELEGMGHKKSEMIKRMEPIWFDYHVESIRLASGKGKKGK